ncbi:MAG TPA: O-antigen ligase family protein [Vicinamibacterales bacterium]|nr:O-antigen ligase family protein [Vicinamibacterales bacterium]
MTLERASALALVAAFGAIQFSIAAGQSLLALAALGWLVGIVRRQHQPAAPAFFLPLILYAVWTLVATVYSRDPGVSLRGNKELLLLLVVPLTMSLLRGDRAARTLDALISIGPLVALVGVYQYALLDYVDLGQRPQGTLGHYMTYSGILMLLVCATAARLLFEPGKRIWPALIMPALLFALAATLSRNAYVGALVGVAVLLLLRDFRLVALLPVAIAGFVLFAPSHIVDRAYSMFDLKETTNRDRVAMLQAGAGMINDEPITGIGPDMVGRVYPEYRTDDAVDIEVPHLHNVPAQIAAERGLPALALWIWFVAVAARDLLRQVRRERTALAAAGLAALAAMVTAGLFEYNFGDSEFLVLLLALITLPFAGSATLRSDSTPAASRAAPSLP